MLLETLPDLLGHDRRQKAQDQLQGWQLAVAVFQAEQLVDSHEREQTVSDRGGRVGQDGFVTGQAQAAHQQPAATDIFQN
jgi:hypothetical protein